MLRAAQSVMQKFCFSLHPCHQTTRSACGHPPPGDRDPGETDLANSPRLAPENRRWRIPLACPAASLRFDTTNEYKFNITDLSSCDSRISDLGVQAKWAACRQHGRNLFPWWSRSNIYP